VGWFDYHLWEFNIDRRKYGLATGAARLVGSNHVRLRDVLKPSRTVIDYTYKLGDCWGHRLTVTDVRTGKSRGVIRAMLAAKETGCPRTAAASRASTNGLKHLQTETRRSC
jgi:hypothetical protein